MCDECYTRLKKASKYYLKVGSVVERHSCQQSSSGVDIDKKTATDKSVATLKLYLLKGLMSLKN